MTVESVHLTLWIKSLKDGTEIDIRHEESLCFSRQAVLEGLSDVYVDEDRGMVRRGLVDARDLGIDVPVLWGFLFVDVPHRPRRSMPPPLTRLDRACETKM
jgi:hypothetical protein